MQGKSMDAFAWQPTGAYLNRSRVRKFMDLHGIQSWQELIRRSTEDIEWFWNSALDFLGVEWFQQYTRLYDDSLGMPWTTWFLGESSTSFITASTGTSGMDAGPPPLSGLSRMMDRNAP